MNSGTPATPSLLQGRLYVLAAAVLWSLSGAFVKTLTQPNSLANLGEPPVPLLLIAFYRTLFAGLAIALTVRRGDVCFSPRLLLMMLSFAAMNATFIAATGLGTSANAIILQYTAPVWMYLAGVFLLKEPPERRNTIALVASMIGVAVILAGAVQGPASGAPGADNGNQEANHPFLAALIALASGITYAGVLIGLRVFRRHSSSWLTVLNHLFAAVVLLPVLWLYPQPTLPQLAFLVLFGVVQMGLPYWLMSRGLKAVNAQEAGTLSLLELILNPVWAYWAAGEVPAPATFYGGGLILAALLWRYWPRRSTR